MLEIEGLPKLVTLQSSDFHFTDGVRGIPEWNLSPLFSIN